MVIRFRWTDGFWKSRRENKTQMCIVCLWLFLLIWCINVDHLTCYYRSLPTRRRVVMVIGSLARISQIVLSFILAVAKLFWFTSFLILYRGGKIKTQLYCYYIVINAITIHTCIYLKNNVLMPYEIFVMFIYLHKTITIAIQILIENDYMEKYS